MKIFRYATDILLFCGSAAIVAGVAMWNVPAAFITGGLLMIGLSFIVGKARLDNEKDGDK